MVCLMHIRKIIFIAIYTLRTKSSKATKNQVHINMPIQTNVKCPDYYSNIGIINEFKNLFTSIQNTFFTIK